MSLNFDKFCDSTDCDDNSIEVPTTLIEKSISKDVFIKKVLSSSEHVINKYKVDPFFKAKVKAALEEPSYFFNEVWNVD